MLRLMVVLTFVYLATAEDIEFSECGKDVSANCEVKAVRLSPCPNVSKKNPCKVRKGASGELQFDFEPQFAADNLFTQFYWVNSVNMDLPLPGMDTDGCHSTHCPTVAGEMNNFAYNLTIKSWFPGGKYRVKSLLKMDKSNQCCFEFTIRIA